jgi:hypothetical protein
MYRRFVPFMALALISGCGVLAGWLELLNPNRGSLGRETGSSELKAFASEEELEDYFADQIAPRNDQFIALDRAAGVGEPAMPPVDSTATNGSGDAAPSPPSSTQESIGSEAGDTDASGGGGFSETTIQEEGVDEADVVKTDGTYLYIIDSTYGDSVLRVIRATPPESMALLSEVSLKGYGRDLYLHDGKVVALTSTYGGFFLLEGGGVAVETIAEGDASTSSDGTDPDKEEPGTEPGSAGSDADVGTDDAQIEPIAVGEPYFERPQTVVTVVDVSTPESPTVLSQTKFDGSPASSRMIDGVLHLVVANYQDYYYDVMPMLGRPELSVTAVSAETVLPKYEQVGADGAEQTGSVVTWREMYHPTDPDGFGVVTLISLDVDNDAAFTAVGVVAEPGLIYSSLEALYLTDTAYDFFGDSRTTTDIYKFAYQERSASAVATGSVPGRILNQYSMGEYNGYLRVATTIDATFSIFGERTSETTNNLYVLGQSQAGALDVVGRIENIAPGETIQSARFMGARGYLVTFEQVDPLFTLDLSSPTDPRIVGELKVPGFSTFIVPMDADHILTVGQYIPPEGSFFGWGVQLSIFDVSNFADPRLAANVVLGDDEGGAYSEALYDPKAFTYFAERGLVALPISIYPMTWFVDEGPLLEDEMPDSNDTGVVDSGEGGVDGGEPVESPPTTEPDEPIDTVAPVVPDTFEGLVVYSVSVEGGFTELGRISTLSDDPAYEYYWPWYTRGVFLGDNVFAVTNLGVRGGPVSNLATIPYELMLEPPVEIVLPEPMPLSGVR